MQALQSESDRLAKLEPRLADVRKWVLRLAEQGRRAKRFCANQVALDRIDPRLCRLIGWDRADGPAARQTSSAYDVAFGYLYQCLPNCRRCACCAALLRQRK